MPSPKSRLNLEPLEPLILLADFYVSATFGNDDWDGSPTHPWATIRTAPPPTPGRPSPMPSARTPSKAQRTNR